MPMYVLDSTQSDPEAFVQSDNDVVLPIEESTHNTESTSNPAILKILELKQCHFCQSEMYSQVLELHLILCHQTYQEPAEFDLNRTLQCLVCQCQLPSELMQDHILQQHPPKPNPKLKNQIQCHYCHMQFSYSNMAQHLECQHGPNAWTECLHCKKMVRNTQIDLEIHLFQEHSGGQFLVCLACDLMYALTGEEQAHMHTHLNYKFKCPLQSCNKIFDTFTSFRHHVLILHPGFEQHMQVELQKQTHDILHPIATSETHPQIRSVIQKLVYGGPVECDIYNERIHNKYSLIEHKNKEHNMNLTFDCEECGLRYSTYRKLANHIRGKHDELLDNINSEHLNVVANPLPFTGQTDNNDHVLKPKSGKLITRLSKRLKLHKANRKFGSKRQNLSYVPLSPVSCDICNYRAIHKLCLLKHINSKHLDVVLEPLPYCCDLCDKEFTTCKKLMVHRRTVHLPKIKCKHCGKMVNQYSMRKHLFRSHGECREKRLQSDKSMSPVQCNICNYKAANKFNLVEHMNSKHLEETGRHLPFSCDLCDKKYDSYDRVVNHRRNVHLPKLQCNECGKIVSQYRMDEHIRQECRESATKSRYLSDVTLSLVPCSLCDHYATDKFTLFEHMNSEHPDNTDQRFRCEVCHRQFIHFHSLMNHRRNVHVPKQQCEKSDKMLSKYKVSNHPKSHDKREEFGAKHHFVSKVPLLPVICSLCNFIANSKFSLVKHLNTDHLDVLGEALPYCCDLCDKSFIQHWHLKEHHKRCHSPKIHCKHCGKLINQYYMFRHVKRFHEKEHQKCSYVQCSMCNYQTTNKLLLVEHVNLKHLDIVGERQPFCCDICSKEFVNYKNVMSHRRHVHVPNVMCKKCGKMIKQYRMSHHLKLHDAGLVKKTHCCEVCNKFFISYKSFMRHQRTHIAKLQCKHCRKMISEDRMEKHLVDFHTKRSYSSVISLHRVQCGICNKNVMNKFCLVKHFNAKHLDVFGEPLPFRCEHCDQEFSNYNGLMRHLKRLHVSKKCHQCDKMVIWYKISEHLKTHERDIDGTSCIGIEGNSTTVMDGFEEKLNSEIEIVEHPIKLEAEEEQMDILPEPQSADVKSAPVEHKLPEFQIVLSKHLVCNTCCFYAENTTEFAMHVIQAHQPKTCHAKPT